MGISTLGSKYSQSAFSLIHQATGDFEKPRQRRHEMWILTCYVNLESVKKLVTELRKSIRLTDVYLAFDISEVFREGPVKAQAKILEIRAWCKSRDVEFSAKALSAQSLVHSKAYAVIQRLDDEISDGITLISSANFTDAGFFGKRNVEIGYHSQKKADIRDFERMYDELWERYGKEIDAEVEAESIYLYKYALLTSGVFLHKWEGSLSQMTGLRYYLTDHAKEQFAVNSELAELGLGPGDTSTRQPLDLDDLPSKAIPGTFIKAFTVETHLGRWCPLSIWTELCSHIGEVDEFVSSFAASTTDNILAAASDRATAAQNRLLSLNYIKAVPSGYTDAWREKIVNLRSNKRKLLRLFTGYEEHDLPYDITAQEEIEDLYDSLSESIRVSGRKNAIMRKVILAASQQSLAPLGILEDDAIQVRKLMRDA